MTYKSATSKKEGNKRQVHYLAEDGSVRIHEDGSRSWRNNNPGNLRFKASGTIGLDDGKFCIFPDVDTGRKAKISLLRGKYNGYDSIKQVLAGKTDAQGKFLPGSGYAPASDSNDPDRYAKTIQSKTGLDPFGKKMADFSDAEIGKIADAMRDVEGWIPGKVIDKAAKPIGPPLPPSPFLDILALENLAIKDGYTVVQRLTSFRKIWYDAANKSYGGVQFRVGAWDLLIPGAKNTPLPPSWLLPANDPLLRRVFGAKVLTLNGMPVDISHVFAGADARNHRSSVFLLHHPLRSNVEATTWVGDLGSVVAEYLHKTTNRDAQVKRTADLEKFFDLDPGKAVFGLEDQTSDLDGIQCPFPDTRTVVDSLNAYYANDGAWRNRSKGFLLSIFPSASAGLRDQVFNAAYAYALAKRWLGDIALIEDKPRPGFHLDLPWIGPIDEISLWEAYFNNSQWVVDIFIERLRARPVG